MSDFELVVTQPFGDHAIGDTISDGDAMDAAPAHCVVRRAKVKADAPQPIEPAPVDSPKVGLIDLKSDAE